MKASVEITINYAILTPILMTAPARPGYHYINTRSPCCILYGMKANFVDIATESLVITCSAKPQFVELIR